jgi:hypothetical protein
LLFCIKLAKIKHIKFIKLGDKMNKAEVKQKVENAIKELIKRDRFLINNYLHEITIAHKLAEYLEPEFKDWDIDIEYNKKIKLATVESNSKEVLNTSVNGQQANNKSHRAIRPDIIVHHRGDGPDNNLLAIELKKVGNYQRVKTDNDTLTQLTDQLGSYKYRFGLFITINRKAEIKEGWFINGVELND